MIANAIFFLMCVVFAVVNAVYASFEPRANVQRSYVGYAFIFALFALGFLGLMIAEVV